MLLLLLVYKILSKPGLSLVTKYPNHFMLIRKLLFTITLILLTITLFSQSVIDDVSLFNNTYDRELIKRNKVTTVIIEMYFRNKSSGKHKFYFNTAGRLIKEVYFDFAGKKLGEYYFTFDKHNQLTGTKQIDYDHNKTYSTTYFRTYFNGKLVKDSSTLLPVCNEYKYDKKGNLIQTIVSSNLGVGYANKRIVLYTLDSLEKITNIRETVYQEKDSIGNVFSNRDIFYNASGKMYKEVEKINTEGLMSNTGSITYIYDSFGNLTQLLRTKAASYYFKYNNKGLITSKRMTMVLDDSKIETIDKYYYIFQQ